jgi:hypothetical protein
VSLRIPSSSRSPDHDPHRTIYYLGYPLNRFAGLKHRQWGATRTMKPEAQATSSADDREHDQGGGVGRGEEGEGERTGEEGEEESVGAAVVRRRRRKPRRGPGARGSGALESPSQSGSGYRPV